MAEKDTPKRKFNFEEFKMKMAKERNTRFMRVNSPLGKIIHNIVKQFEMGYERLKFQMMEFNGVSIEEATEIIHEAHDIAIRLNRLAERVAGLTGLKYYIPRDLEAYMKNMENEKAEDDPLNELPIRLAAEGNASK